MALAVAQFKGNKIASNSSLTVTLDATPDAGKVLVAGLVANGGTARTFTATDWTPIERVDHTTNSACAVYIRTAPGGTAAFTFGLDSSSVNWLAAIYELTDANATPDQVAEAFNSSGDPTLSIDPVDASANKLFLLFVGNRANASFTPDSSPAMSEGYDDVQTGGTAFSMHASHSTSTFTSGASVTLDSNSTANASWVAIAVCMIESTGSATFSAATAAATAAGQAAAMTAGALMSGATAAATAAGQAATMTGGALFGAVTAAATANGQAATLTGGALFGAVTAAAAADAPEATMTGGGGGDATFSAVTAAASATAEAASMTGGALMSAATAAATAAAEAVTFTAGAVFEAATALATATAQAATMTGDQVVEALGRLYATVRPTALLRATSRLLGRLRGTDRDTSGLGGSDR